jgi:LysM repeat protein
MQKPVKSVESTAYKVKAGDSLEKIARHHRVSLSALKECNHLEGDKITVGQSLHIPSHE